MSINPHLVAAILDGVNHRFILVMELENIKLSLSHCEIPRFSIGGSNATSDPRLCKLSDLTEVKVASNAFKIPLSKIFLCYEYMFL